MTQGGEGNRANRRVGEAVGGESRVSSRGCHAFCPLDNRNNHSLNRERGSFYITSSELSERKAHSSRHFATTGKVIVATATNLRNVENPPQNPVAVVGRSSPANRMACFDPLDLGILYTARWKTAGGTGDGVAASKQASGGVLQQASERTASRVLSPAPYNPALGTADGRTP